MNKQSHFQVSKVFPILIWVDKQMYIPENQQYCNQLQTHYLNLFQAFDKVSDACNLLNQIGENDVTILTSAECAYQLIKYTKQNLVIFCGNKYNHFDLFVNNSQIKAIISNSFYQAHENAILCMNQTDIYNDFLQLLSPPQQNLIEYQHSKDYVSIQFLVVIEEIRRNKEPKEEEVFAEIDSLLTISQKQKEKKSIFEDLQNKEKEKQSKQFSLFEKVVYLYSREEIYQAFNQQFAKHNYQQIKNIILCLYQGFKQEQQRQNKFKYLYRGISIDSCDRFEQIILDLYSSESEGSSLFWNTITSTSLSSQVAKNFSSQTMFGIFYQINLDEDVPHPCFQLQNYHSEFPSEQEVLLFPQFQFVIQNIESNYSESRQLYIVTIKQVKNNFAFALDPNLRKIYWDQVIKDKIKPKIETLVNFHSRRIFELTQFFAEETYDLDIYMDEILERIEKELKNIFKQIQLNLFKILTHSNYSEIQDHISNLTQTYMSIIKLQGNFYQSDQLFLQIEEYLDQIMRSLRQNICTLILKGIINIEFQKEYLQNLQKKFKEKTKQQTIQVTNNQQMDYKFSNSQPINQGNTAGLTYQQLKAQKITSLQQVQHKNGNLAYEVTLQDGNKLLMHQNPNNNNELSFSKKIDATGKNGYSNKWEKVGKPIKTESVTVQDVSQSIKGQNQKFDVNNVKAIETNYQFQQARINGQIGGIIAGTLGSLTVDFIMDGVNKEKLKKGLIYSATVQGGIMYAQSVQSLARVAPFVGIGFTALMTSISVGGIFLSDFLSQSEKVYNSIFIALKTGTAIGLGFLGIEGGMALGALGGPVGVVIGGILGGFVGGAGGNMLGRVLDHFTQFNMEVSFKQRNKSTVKEGYLINPGMLPKISWSQTKDKVRSLILIAQTDTHLACVIPNINRDQTQISENEDVGIQFNQYKYIGPDDSCETITFRLLATTEEYVNEDEILQQLQSNETSIIDFAQVKINLKNIQ